MSENTDGRRKGTFLRPFRVPQALEKQEATRVTRVRQIVVMGFLPNRTGSVFPHQG